MLLIGMIGSVVCYLAVGLTSNLYVGFISCIATGIFVAMLWPGALIMMEEKLPAIGVGAYALMAAGGDLGASVAPQLMGIVADNSSLQTGMLVCAAFPVIGVLVVIIAMRFFKKKEAALLGMGE